MTEEPIDLVALRDMLGWTQQQVADYCGTDRSTVSRWEKDPPSKGPALILLRQLRSDAKRSAASDNHDLSQDADRVSLAGAGADLASAPALSCQVPAVCDSDLAFSTFMGATGAPDADAPVSKQEAAE